MSETIRIRTTPNGNDTYVKVKIDQEFDFLEVLSLKISDEDAYRTFCSDYGTIVGRVIFNGGVGLPNARVSIFIPLDEDDKNNSVIRGLYPYEIITDSDSNRIRYNLLPKTSESNNECFTPIGSFPNKREILDNPELEYVYCKYYKFTTTTNEAGDFMFFGVPLGTHTVHVDADISDIGIYSQRPYDLITQGTPVDLFDSPTKFKGSVQLDRLVQVKTVNYAVNVQPFWGDTETCEVGITRADIDMNFTIVPSAIFMGSIFGDDDKNSVNKRCRPRKKLGTVTNLVTGEGRIEMIRKTIDETIEPFDIKDGDLIDEDGTWAYQIPMNLDYMVTDEFGNLIPSEDPNKGIATKASVRFRIGMENTGGEGRLRTRGKFLVPNNPRTSSEADYTFDEKTKDISFRDIYWNKIYSVKNFIPRFQANGFEYIRAFTGLKDVDSDGNKTPVPFNRVNTDFNPIFLIICIIIKIITFLIWIMNVAIFPIINLLIWIIRKIIGFWNSLMGTLCDWSDNCILNLPSWLGGCYRLLSFLSPTCNWILDLPSYVKCIVLECPFPGGDGEPNDYAPGCKKSNSSNIDDEPFRAGHGQWVLENGRPIDFYPGTQGIPENGYSAAGYDNCIAFIIAKALNMFQYDFYNDWLNGGLFGFLLKYKKKRKGRELFCEYDCNPQFFSQGGVDGNNNGVGDNDCRTNYLLDTCYSSNSNPLSNSEDCEQQDYQTIIREGVIKKVNTFVNGIKVSEEMYYASSKHDTSYRLFATDLICLGSIFDCDWQGIPKLQQYLIPTTYKMPPDTVEFVGDTAVVETTGIVTLTPAMKGLFFDIDCTGLSSDYRQVLNIRHICEMGVDIDEIRDGSGTSTIAADFTIGKDDIDDGGGKFFRDIFYYLNKDYPMQLTTPFPYASLPFSTDFNIQNTWFYPFASNTAHNGQNYLDFRGYQAGSDIGFGQAINNSYFFYFGLLPGKGSLEKMNKRFFTRCIPEKEKEFNILVNSNAATSVGGQGSIVFSVVSGTAPFTYTFSGPQNGNGTIPLDGSGQPTNVTLNLPIGNYEIEVIDANGNNATVTISVDGPPPLYVSAKVTNFVSNSTSNDGVITIDGVGGGTGVYTYNLYKNDGTTLVSSGNITTVPFKILNLPAHILSDGATPPNYGYILKVSDGVSNVFVKNLKLDGPTALIITQTLLKNVSCHFGNDGAFKYTITGGKTPYTTTVQTSYGSTYNLPEQTNVKAGTFTMTVVDDYGTTANQSFSIVEDNPATLSLEIGSGLSKQCDPNNYKLRFVAPSGGYSNIKMYYKYNGGAWTNANSFITTNYSNPSSEMELVLPKSTFPSLTSFQFKFISNDEKCESSPVTTNEGIIRLPISLLSVNTNSIDNTKQCDPNTVTFKVNVSHWQSDPNYTQRKPYTFKFKVNNGTEQTVDLTSHQQQIVGVMPSATGSAVITYTITDNKGCTASGTLPTITLPTVALNGYWSYGTDSNGSGTKTLNKSGGLGSTTVWPLVLTSRSITQSVTITDSVGCKFTTPQSTT